MAAVIFLISVMGSMGVDHQAGGHGVTPSKLGGTHGVIVAGGEDRGGWWKGTSQCRRSSSWLPCPKSHPGGCPVAWAKGSNERSPPGSHSLLSQTSLPLMMVLVVMFKDGEFQIPVKEALGSRMVNDRRSSMRQTSPTLQDLDLTFFSLDWEVI